MFWVWQLFRGAELWSLMLIPEQKNLEVVLHKLISLIK